MLKKQYLILLFIFVIKSVCAQDTITTTDATKIAVKVLQISATEVRYKKFEMPDGPSYIESISQIKSIRYANGSVDVFKSTEPEKAEGQAEKENGKFTSYNGTKYLYKGNYIRDNNMYKIMLNETDPELELAVKKAKKAKYRRYFLIGAVPCAMIMMTCFSASLRYGSSNGVKAADTGASQAYFNAAGIFGVGALGFAATGIVFNVQYKKKKALAVEIYNRKH